MDRELDCRAKACPLPVMETRKALQEMSGDVLTVLVDNEPSSQNVSRAAAKLGCEVAIEQVAGDYCIRIRKHAACDIAGDDEAQTQKATAVWIPSRTFGRGNDELGAILMKSFLFTLAQEPYRPTRVVLANRGVELCCEGSEVLESLRALEEAGVEIIACGTCLDFLGLMDKIVVGTVSNMADIVEALSGADKLITV